MKINLISILLFLVLAHTTYSATTYRARLKSAQIPFESLPNDIIAECLIGFILLLINFVYFSSFSLNKISHKKHFAQRTYETLRNHPEFMTFNHRLNPNVNKISNDQNNTIKQIKNTK
eukprot:TRINITY_DN829_c1_g1_i1.p1 TRINITY_DN829_c1_g1~~TRINITY_DN829_c1_g1_i1.p1  ORF type:complete len:118 (-),score=32.50 TRINITY_DN829_c1_g1_i1:130-483(-)